MPIAQSTAQWRQYRVRVGQFVSLTSQVRLRFIATDLGTASTVEAALDDFTAVGITCAPAACAADWNGNGSLSVQDIFDFLASYFGSGADIDHSGDTSVQDLFTFLALYFAGC